MSRALSGALFATLVATITHAATITGTVAGDDGRPIAGALVQVLRQPGEPACSGQSTADGTFKFDCELTGTRSVRAVYGERAPASIDKVELGADREVQLNFKFGPAGTPAAAASAPAEHENPESVGTRAVPNPVTATDGSGPIGLRTMAIIVVVLAVLGVLAILRRSRRRAR